MSDAPLRDLTPLDNRHEIDAQLTSDRQLLCAAFGVSESMLGTLEHYTVVPTGTKNDSGVPTVSEIRQILNFIA